MGRPVSSSCCEITDRAFSDDEARQEARRYLKHGPAGQTRHLLEAIRSTEPRDASLLDVGGGIGAIHHELLDDVASTATHVDASTAYLNQAREAAKRRGHADRVEFMHADFLDVAPDLPPADIVTLDRVVCCYPDFRGLLQAASGRTLRLLGLVYPRDVWYLRLGMAVVNFFQRLRGDPFRVYVHPVIEMEDILGRAGLHRVFLKRLLVWEVALYSRS
jgi:magnesium-protoporphyrin O-methyltransferase